MSGTIFSSEESFSKKKNGFHLNLAFQSLEEIPADIIRKHACRTTSIDFSYNNFKELHSFYDFQRLHTIIIDHNALGCHVAFPVLEKLRLISINANQINNLSIFITRLSQDVPKLKYLSMMKNEAAPSYFNGGTKAQNQDYRHFVISHFAYLESLDGESVTEQEKSDAYEIYGRRWRKKKIAPSRAL